MLQGGIQFSHSTPPDGLPALGSFAVKLPLFKAICKHALPQRHSVSPQQVAGIKRTMYFSIKFSA